MPGTLTYRTSDGTRWGSGQGSDLSAPQVDLNFFTLFAAVQTLEDTQATVAQIDYLTITGNQLFVTLTNHRVLGPLTVPTAIWNPRGQWLPLTTYAAFDVFTNNGSLYLSTQAHTSGATFSPNATDGLGHNLYMLILAQPANALPGGGTIGQRLVKQSGSPFVTAWQSDFLRIAIPIAGQPLPNELLMQWAVTDHCTLPAGLAGSVAYARTPTHSTVAYSISKNGAPIGSIIFHGPSPSDVTVEFSTDVILVPGDIVAVNGPVAPDSAQADITITLLVILT
jgi:hypothetical protein